MTGVLRKKVEVDPAWEQAKWLRTHCKMLVILVFSIQLPKVLLKQYEWSTSLKT